VAEKGGPILGVHIAGRGPPSSWPRDLAVNWEATAEEVARLVHPHPTLSEVFGRRPLPHRRSLHG